MPTGLRPAPPEQFGRGFSMGHIECGETVMDKADLIPRLQQLGVGIENAFRLPQVLNVEPPVVIAKARFERQLSIGAYSYIGQSSEMRGVEIGRFCSIARRVMVAQSEHPTDFVSTHPISFNPSSGFSDDEYFSSVALRRPVGRSAGVSIGHDVWICDGAIVRAGVSIGTGAIIGAGAVVVSDVAPYAIVGGVPARLIRMRFDEATIARLLASTWWMYDIRRFRELMGSPHQFLDSFEPARERMPPLAVRSIEVSQQAGGRYLLKIADAGAGDITG